MAWKNTDEESAEFKERLRTEAVTPALRQEAIEFPAEAEEAIMEVEAGLIACKPESWVAEQLRKEDRG